MKFKPLTLLVLVMALMIGNSIFYFGVHNMDNANDIKRTLNLVNKSLEPIAVKTISGDILSLQDAYLLGLRQIKIGFGLTALNMLLLGMAIMWVEDE